MASGVGRVSSMCVAGRLLEDALTTGAFIRLAYVFAVCGGRLSGMINFSHEACKVVSRGVISLGTFPSSVVDGKSKVALRISMEIRREVLGPYLSPFGNLAMITLLGWICNV